MMNHEQKAGRLETWRAIVVAPELGRLRATMSLDAIEFFDPLAGWVWRASHRTSCWCGGAVHDAVATSAPAAVLVALASFCRVHDKVVEEVRGPGERTTADQVAAAEREVQRRCVLICESVALAQPDGHDRRDLASDAAEAIRGMVFSVADAERVRTDALEEQLAAVTSELRIARRQLEIEHASHVATAAARDLADALRADNVRLRRMVDTATPWGVSDPPTDEEMRALRLRWANGPERYQADADALIAAVISGRKELNDARAEAAGLRALHAPLVAAMADYARATAAHRAHIDAVCAVPPRERTRDAMQALRTAHGHPELKMRDAEVIVEAAACALLTAIAGESAGEWLRGRLDYDGTGP